MKNPILSTVVLVMVLMSVVWGFVPKAESQSLSKHEEATLSMAKASRAYGIHAASSHEVTWNGVYETSLQTSASVREDSPAVTGVADSFGFPLVSYASPSPGSGLDHGDLRWAGTYHLGEDVYASEGTPVYAAADGEIKLLYSKPQCDNYGHAIAIEHRLPAGDPFGDYVVTIYGHLKGNFQVGYGTVSKGQLIGYIGAKAPENGCYDTHLHFGIRRGRYDSVIRGLGGSSYLAEYWDPTDFVQAHSGPDPSKGCADYSYDGAVLFDGDDCGGSQFRFPAATGLVNLTDYDWNDRTQSIHIAPGWSALTYQHSDRGGDKRCVTGSMWDLSVDGFDGGQPMDREISSLQVFANPTCARTCASYNYTGIVAFAEDGCKGSELRFPSPTGLVNLTDLGWNDRVRSLHVAPGWSLMTHQHTDGGGDSRCVTGSMWDLSVDRFDGGTPMDQEISSVRALDNSTCTVPCSPPAAPAPGMPANGSSLFPEDMLEYRWAGNAGVYQVHWWGGVGGDHYSDWMSGTSWDVGQQWESSNAYYWRVRGRNGAGCEGEWSASQEFLIGPRSPDDLSASTVSCKQIELSWQDRSTSESDYHIERSVDGSKWQTVATVNGTAHQDTNLSSAIRYYYRTRAHRHHDDTFSKHSSVSSASTEQCPSPETPTLNSPKPGVTLEPAANITLDWEGSNGATDYAAHLWGGPSIDIESGWTNATDWQVGQLWPGTYQWQVKARNGAGESDWSAEWSFTVSTHAPQMTQALSMSPPEPLSGEEVVARFAIKNVGGQDIKLQRLLVGVHGPDCATWECSRVADFHHEENVTLRPGQIHTYRHARVFSEPGQYMVIPLYVDSEGAWHTLADQTTFTVSPRRQGGPVLEIPQRVSAFPGSTVTVPIGFSGNSLDVVSLAFSIDYDQEWLTLDQKDKNGDGIPDSIALSIPVDFNASVAVDPGDLDGELDVFVGDLGTPLTTLPDGTFLSLTFNTGQVPGGGIAGVRFAQEPPVSYGSTNGLSIEGTAKDGSVQIGGELFRAFIPAIRKIR